MRHKRLLGLINSLQTAVYFSTAEVFEHEAMDALGIPRKHTSAMKKAIIFLRDWLINPINGTDKQYSAYLIEKGVKKNYIAGIYSDPGYTITNRQVSSNRRPKY